MKYYNFISLILALFLTACNTFEQAKEMPIPKNLEQASVQVRSVIVGLRDMNSTMLEMSRYDSTKGQKVKEFLDCVKGQMDSLLWFRDSITEPEKLLEAQNMLNLLLLIETQKFGGTYGVGDSCRLSG